MIVKKIILVALLVAIGWLITYWVVSIIKCEMLTIEHRDEFIGLELQTNMLTLAETIKVLNYSEETATVYYKDQYGGNILEFRRNNNIWIFNRWGATVWSRQGSADGFMWPYIR